MKKNILLFFFVFPTISHAEEIINTCWDDTGQNNFNVTFNAGVLTSGKAGTKAEFRNWSVPGYTVKCSTDFPDNIFRGTIAFQMQTQLPSVGGGFFKVNEDFDVKFTSPDVPTTDYASNLPSDFTKYQGIFFRPLRGVGNGYVTLRLRRDQLGGALYIPPGVPLFNIHSTLSTMMNDYKQTKVKNQTPIARIFSAEQYIPLPVVCQINGSTAIEVDFGDIDNTKISRDGSRYVKTVPLQYRCNTPVTQNISINLAAAPAAFSADIIGSSLPEDIGVMVKYNGAQVKPNGKFNTTLVNGRGQDELQVAPVINDATKSVTGSFTASATLVMTLQ